MFNPYFIDTGSLTEERAKKASQHINNEVLILISVIRGIGDEDPDSPGIYTVPFGKLFEYYTTISNKVRTVLFAVDGQLNIVALFPHSKEH